MPIIFTKGYPIMAMRNPFRKKDGTINPIAIVAVVLLALIIVFGVSLAVSANRALGLATQAREAFSEASTNLEDGKYEEAYAKARSAVDSVSALPQELEGPQWSIASVLPVLGTDVQMAREMSSIAGKLADEAATPVFDQWDSITQTLSQDDAISDAGQLVALLEKNLSQFADTLTHAKQVVLECEQRANALPTAHIGQLNDAASELRDTLTTIGDMLRTFDQVASEFDPASLLGNVLKGIDFKSLLGSVDLSGLLGN